MTIFYFVFKRFFRRASNIIFLVVMSLGAIFLPVVEWPILPLGFQYYGIILMYIAARLTSITTEDRTNRTLVRIGVAPITHFQYLWQNLLAYSLILLGLNSVVVIGGIFVHGEALINPILLFVVYSFFSMTAIGFSLAWYSLFRCKDTAFSVLSGMVIVIAMLGGVMWPIQIMPVVIQRVAMLLPTYWFAEGMRLVTERAPVFELTFPLIMMFMFSIVFTLLGSRREIV